MTEQETFHFQEDTHTYTLGGERLLSVTEVLEDAEFIDTRWYPKEAGIRGKRVHLLCQYDDEGFYADGEAKRFGLEGYLESWRKFKKGASPKFLEIEKPRYHPTHRYAGTPDRLAIWKNRHAILDLKSGPPEFWHGYQTGGYEKIYEAAMSGIGQFYRFGIHLQKDGSAPNVALHDDSTDGDYFLAFLATTRQRRKHGIDRRRA